MQTCWLNPYEHVRIAQSAHHPLLAPHIIDDTSIFALEIQEQLGPDVPRWRAEMIAEIAEIRHECTDDTQQWFESLPSHGQIAYGSGRTFPNVPLLRRLGSMIQFPAFEELLDDITTGFPMCGRLTPGACWDSKDEWVPKDPLSRSEFFQKNQEHIDTCLLTRKPDRYASEMLATVLKEVREGKMSGPYEAPKHWATTMVAPSEHDQSSLLQLPSGPVAAAVAFSIVTEGA